MTYEESRHVNFKRPEDYGEKGNTIGQGTYGTVFLLKKDDVRYAVKKMKHDEDSFLAKSTLNEIASLLRLVHKNIIEMVDVFIDQKITGSTFIIMEYFGQDLYAYRDLVPMVRPSLVRSVTNQILSALSYMHSRDHIHRDIKPQNILIDNNANIKIADFGLATSITCAGATKTELVYTLWFRPPEILLGGPYDTKADIWAAGCSILDFVRGRAPFQGNNGAVMLFDIYKTLGTPNELRWSDALRYPYWFEAPKWPENLWYEREVDEQTFEILKKMIVLDPAKRSSAREILGEEGNFQDCISSITLRSNYPLRTLSDEILEDRRHIFSKLLSMHQDLNYSHRIYFMACWLFDKTVEEVNGSDTEVSVACYQISQSYNNDVLSEDFSRILRAAKKHFRLIEEKLVRILYFRILRATTDLVVGLSIDYLMEYGKFYPETVKRYATQVLIHINMTDAPFRCTPEQLALSSIYVGCVYYKETFKHYSKFDPAMEKCMIKLDEQTLEKIREVIGG